MIEKNDAKKVVEVIGNNLIGVSHKKGTFGVIITYSEDGKDVDELMKMYEEWAKQNKTKIEKTT